MVDPVSNSGGVAPIKNVAPKPQFDSNKDAQAAVNAAKSEAASSASPVDTVEISTQAQEALSAAQAEQVARDVRTALQKDLDKVLGIDPSFAEQIGDGDEAPV